MFNFIFQATQAYYQVGFFVAAAVCLGLGGLLLSSSLYWRIHAIRVKGTIVGVLEKAGMYTPVYRYTLPNGDIETAKSDTSYGSLAGKRTGSIVPLLISPNDRTQARESHSLLLECIGILLIAPGVWFGYTALTSYPVTWMTWAMAAAMLVYLAERSYRLLIPKGQRLSLADWRKQRGLGGAIDMSQVKRIEDILATPDEQQKLQTQQTNNRRAAPIVAVFVLALFAAGIYQGRNIARLEAFGVRAEGEVVRIAAESNSGARYSYYPVVRYRTEQNAFVEFKDSIGTNPPSYRSGDKVSVLYLPDDPRGGAIIDRGAFWNWAIPALLLLGAALLGWLCVYMLSAGDKRRVPNGPALAA